MISCGSFLICSHRLARRSQLSPLDSSVISRLLAPTQASLARSKSAATLSADGQDPSGNRRAAKPGSFMQLLFKQEIT